MNRVVFFATAVLTINLWAAGASAEVVDWKQWTIRAQESHVEEYQGQRALFLRGGRAVLESADFRDGVIEFDVAIPPDRGFSGVGFRHQDEANFESFYVRHHQSGNPDANQYTPVFNGSSAWQLYHGPHFASPSPLVHDQWMHIKLVISGSRAEVYIGDMETPSLFIPRLLQKNVSGFLTVSSGFAPARFANFEYRPLGQTELRGTAAQVPPPPDNLVSAWSVSGLVNEQDLAEMLELPSKELSQQTWTTVQAAETGVTNLAEVQGRSEDRTAALAKFTVTTEQQTIRMLEFGYSDRAAVFLNGKLLYRGQRNYQSRDYRYLGTIGLFDSVVLSLEEGANEVVIAVGESFGGWGVIARLDDLQGLGLTP